MPQFELEPASSYYGSYIDNIITGSMLPNGLRGFVGSYVSGNFAFRSAKIFSDYEEKFLTRDASSFSRNPKFFSKEIIYSSIIPNLFSIYELNGGKYCYSQIDGNTFPAVNARGILKMIYGGFEAHVTGTNGGQVSDNTWRASFPFMKEYFNIPRLFNEIFPEKQFVSYIEDDASPITYTPLFTNASFATNRFNINFATYIPGLYHVPFIAHDNEGFVNSGDGFTTTTNGIELSKNQIIKMIFGSKVGFRINGFSISYPLYDVFGVGLRGWKYGLYSGFKSKTSMVFRNGRFGQFRDILEQRIYTKNYIEENGTIDVPITINFVSGTEAWITASSETKLTSSALYDTEYRGGLPWIDQ